MNKLTKAQERALKLLVSLADKKIPDGGRLFTIGDAHKVEWAQAWETAEARKSKATSGEWPWNVTISSLVASSLLDSAL